MPTKVFRVFTLNFICLFLPKYAVIDHEKTQLNMGKSHRKYRQTATELAELKEGPEIESVSHVYDIFCLK